MSYKVDMLFKKATTFERLALYPDRKSFLHALAQIEEMRHEEPPLIVKKDENPEPWNEYLDQRLYLPGDPRGNKNNWVEYMDPSDNEVKLKYTGKKAKEPLRLFVPYQKDPAPWDMFDKPDSLRQESRWMIGHNNAGELGHWYVGPPVDPDDVQYSHSIMRKMWDTYKEFYDPYVPPTEPVDRDISLNHILKQIDAPATPERAKPAPAKPAPTVQQWVQQLINTLNAYSRKAATMNDQQKISTLKQLNNTTLAELVRLKQQTGGSNNPYASPQEQAMVEAIDQATKNFGNAFSAHITEAPNYSKLTQD